MVIMIERKWHYCGCVDNAHVWMLARLLSTCVRDYERWNSVLLSSLPLPLSLSAVAVWVLNVEHFWTWLNAHCVRSNTVSVRAIESLSNAQNEVHLHSMLYEMRTMTRIFASGIHEHVAISACCALHTLERHFHRKPFVGGNSADTFIAVVYSPTQNRNRIQRTFSSLSSLSTGSSSIFLFISFIHLPLVAGRHQATKYTHKHTPLTSFFFSFSRSRIVCIFRSAINVWYTYKNQPLVFICLICCVNVK